VIRFDAIILAGGRGSRLGGVDKGALPVGGRPLLDRVLEAARDAERVVVVGDGPVPDGVLLTREEPVFGGPAAAVVAGLRALRMPSALPIDSAARLVLVLACDLPEAPAGVELLLEVATRSEGDEATHPVEGGIPDARGERTLDGWCLAEEDRRLQWLFGLYRAGALERAAEALGDPTDRSMGWLLSGLDLVAVPAPARVTMDIDTLEDLQRWTT
jgi:molybdopterin-guanine dinucleotide biosynthesis protein A